jgi:hypothetical protein
VKPLTPGRAILYAALVVGTLDLLDAFIFFYLRSGAAPIGILHGIAAGVLGPVSARAGGLPAAALGLVLHFLIAAIIASVYVVASRWLPPLRQRPFVCGLVYGVIAYFVMTWLVVPLSNAGSGSITLAWPARAVMVNGVLIHAFGVGLPTAVFAARVPG